MKGKNLKKYMPRMIKNVGKFTLNWMSDLFNHLVYDRRGSKQLEQWIRQIPCSNGSRYYQKLDVNVGIVADPFVFQNYEPTCHLIALTPENWREKLSRADCLLVTSAWRGLNQEWFGLGHADTPVRRELLTMMRQAREQGIPVLFYSKEDPPNFQGFVEYAKEADYVFTSAEECIPAYQEQCPDAIVQAMTFAINPMIHNPLGSARRKWEGKVFFAGSWMKKYPERTEKMETLFSFIQRAGLEYRIADRNFSRRDYYYQYPLRFLRYVLGSYNYNQLAAIYKVFPWCLNINSVTNSNTMFAMRVYDALACGSQVLSNESKGVRRLFPQVHMIDTFDDLAAAVAMSEDERKTEKLSGIRRVFGEGTVFEKMAQMLRSAGISHNFEEHRPVAVVLSPDISKAEQDRYVQMFAAQSYPNKKLFCSWQELPDDGRFDMVTVWGPDRNYGEFYLEDMINGFKYTDCDYVTKYPAGGETAQTEYEYTDRIEDIYATVFWRESCTMHQLQSYCDEKEIWIPNGLISDASHYDMMT